MNKYSDLCASICTHFFHLSEHVTNEEELVRIAEDCCQQIANHPNRIDSVAYRYINQINTVGNFRLRHIPA